jgi:outer membrane lipoprotein-sorting protein
MIVISRHLTPRSLLVLLLATALPVSAQSLGEIFARLDKASQQFKSLEAGINRNVHTAVINDDARDSGTIRVKREKSQTRMLIDFTMPDPKTVAIDSMAVSIYYPKIKTVQVYDLGNRKNLVDQFLLLGFGATSAELQAAYDVSLVGAEKIGGQQTGHIRLVPKSKDVEQRLQQAELWIAESNGLPAQQKFVTSSTGDFTLVTYSNVKSNPSLSDNSLKLSYPKGVKVEHPQR